MSTGYVSSSPADFRRSIVAPRPEPASSGIPVQVIETSPRETARQVESVIRSLGDVMTVGGRSIQARFDEDLNMVIVRVISKETGEVIRQIPPQEYLDFTVRFREMLGVLFDGQF